MPLPSHFYFIIGIVIMIVVIGVIFITRIIRSRLNMTKDSLAKLAGDLKAELQGDTFTGFFKNIHYRCQYQAGNRNRPSSLTITLSSSFPEEIVIRRERWFDRFSKTVNLVSEIQTGDPLFDESVYIETDKTLFTESFLMAGSNRSIIHSIFSNNPKAKKMLLSGGGASVTILPCDFDDINSSRIEDILDCLARLTEKFQGGGEIRTGRGFLKGYPVILISTGALLCLLGLIALIAGSNLYCPIGNDIYRASFSYSLPIIFIFLLFMYFYLRGGSRSHKIFFTVAAVFTAAFIFSSMGGMVFVNGHFDKSKPVDHRVRIIGKYYKKQKNSNTYHISFPSWTKPGESENIRVDSGFYRRLKTGDPVIIKTGKGFLDYEWLVSAGLP